MIVSVVAVVGALVLAALLGVSDAPNSTAALLAARTGSYFSVAAWSLTWHVVGGLLAGEAVAPPLEAARPRPRGAEPRHRRGRSALAPLRRSAVDSAWVPAP